jgi:hypothetical protein
LTLTVTGTVQFAQLEAGAFATSYIPTTVAQVTRAADVATMTGTNFSDWYNATEGAFNASFNAYDVITSRVVLSANDGGTNNRIQMYLSTAAQGVISSGGSSVATLNGTAPAANTNSSISLAYKVDDFGLSVNGGSVATDTSGAVPVLPTQLTIGYRPTTSFFCGHLQKIQYYPQRLINAELQAFSK